MYRPASLLLLFALAFPSWVGALALGEIELRSKLSQELQARVPLIGVDAADLEGMNVGLASAETFQRAGVDRPFVLTGLRFRVVQTDGGAHIAITTRDPVNEPFLNFLMEMDWPTGRLVREFTLLLDPPVYGAALQSASESLVTPAAPSASAPATGLRSSSGTTRPASRAGASLAGSYGPVRRTDTAWSIATRARPDNTVTVQQTMLAILQANPEAFINGNVNTLRAGSVLQLPDRDRIAAVDAGAAVAEVRRQNADWAELRRAIAGRPAATGAGTQTARAEPSSDASGSGTAASTPPAQPPATTSASAAQQGGEVVISGGSGDGAAGGDADSGALASMETRLDSAMEELGQLQSQVEDLDGKLGEADALIDEMNRMLQVRDDELAALTRKLADAEEALAGAAEAAAAQPEPTQTTESATAGGDAQGQAGTGQGTSTDTGATAQTEPTPPAQPVQDPTPPPAPKEWYEEILDQVRAYVPIDNPVVGGGLVVGILAILGLGVALRRRGKSTSEAEPSSPGLEEVMQNPEVYADERTQLADDDDATEFAQTVAADFPSQAADDTTGAPTMRADQVAEEDPLQEVNVYLAYEQFEQAEQVVRNAIEQHPERHEYQLKLMEVQHAARDRDGMMKTMAVLGAAVGADHALMGQAQSLVDSMPVQVPASASDTGTELQGEPGGTDTVDAGLDFDLGFEGGGSDAPTVSAESSVDFDLGLDFEADPAEGGGDLDFTLDAADEIPGASGTADGGTTDLDFTLDAADEFPADTAAEAATSDTPDPTGTDIDFDLGSEDLLGDDEVTQNVANLGPIGAQTEVLDFDVAFGGDSLTDEPAAEPVAESGNDGDTADTGPVLAAEAEDSLTVDNLDFDLGSLDEGPVAPETDTVAGAPDGLPETDSVGGLDLDFDLDAGADSLDLGETAPAAENPPESFETIKLDVGDDDAPESADEQTTGDDSLLGVTETVDESSSPSLIIEMDDTMMTELPRDFAGSDEDTGPQAAADELDLGDLDGADGTGDVLDLGSDDMLDLGDLDGADDDDVARTELLLDEPAGNDDTVSVDPLGVAPGDAGEEALDIDFDLADESDSSAPTLSGDIPLADDEASIDLDLDLDDDLSGPSTELLAPEPADDSLPSLDLPADDGPAAEEATPSADTLALDMAGAFNLDDDDAGEDLLDIDLEPTTGGADDEQTNPALTIGGGGDDEVMFEVDTGEGDGLVLGETERTLATTPPERPELEETAPEIGGGEDDDIDFDLTDFDPLGSDEETVVAGPADFAELETVVGEPSPIAPSESSDGAQLDFGDEETVDVSNIPVEGSGAAEDSIGLDFDFDDVESGSGGTTSGVGLGTIDGGIGGEPDEDEDETLILGRSLGGDVDEVQTKLDLAQEYVSMGDSEAAREVLDEVMAEGNDAQKQAASGLLDQLS